MIQIMIPMIQTMIRITNQETMDKKTTEEIQTMTDYSKTNEKHDF